MKAGVGNYLEKSVAIVSILLTCVLLLYHDASACDPDTIRLLMVPTLIGVPVGGTATAVVYISCVTDGDYGWPPGATVSSSSTYTMETRLVEEDTLTLDDLMGTNTTRVPKRANMGFMFRFHTGMAFTLTCPIVAPEIVGIEASGEGMLGSNDLADLAVELYPSGPTGNKDDDNFKSNPPQFAQCVPLPSYVTTGSKRAIGKGFFQMGQALVSESVASELTFSAPEAWQAFWGGISGSFFYAADAVALLLDVPDDVGFSEYLLPLVYALLQASDGLVYDTGWEIEAFSDIGQVLSDLAVLVSTSSLQDRVALSSHFGNASSFFHRAASLKQTLWEMSPPNLFPPVSEFQDEQLAVMSHSESMRTEANGTRDLVTLVNQWIDAVAQAGRAMQKAAEVLENQAPAKGITSQLSEQYNAVYSSIPFSISDLTNAGCGQVSLWDGTVWQTSGTFKPLTFYWLWVSRTCTVAFFGSPVKTFFTMPSGNEWWVITSTRSWNDIQGSCRLKNGPYTYAGNTWKLLATTDAMDGFHGYWVEVDRACETAQISGSFADLKPDALPAAQAQQVVPEQPPVPVPPSPPGGPADTTIQQALDRNGNGVFEDEEILVAIQYWISGEVVRPTDQVISDALMKSLIQMWITGARIQTSGFQTQKRETEQDPTQLTVTHFSLSSLSIDGAANSVQFAAHGAGVTGIEVRVFDLSGKPVFDSGLTQGNSLRWNLLDQTGRTVANAVYLCVVTAHGLGGPMPSKVLKLVVLR